MLYVVKEENDGEQLTLEDMLIISLLLRKYTSLVKKPLADEVRSENLEEHQKEIYYRIYYKIVHPFNDYHWKVVESIEIKLSKEELFELIEFIRMVSDYTKEKLKKAKEDKYELKAYYKYAKQVYNKTVVAYQQV